MIKTTLWVFFILSVLAAIYVVLQVLRYILFLIAVLFAGWLVWQCLVAASKKKLGEP